MLDAAGSTLIKDSQANQEMGEADFDLESMPDDEIFYVLRNDDDDSKELSEANEIAANNCPGILWLSMLSIYKQRWKRMSYDLEELVKLVCDLVRLIDPVAPPVNDATKGEKESHAQRDPSTEADQAMDVLESA
nr:hypothetical protein [Tanacetum cinerariifolium]